MLTADATPIGTVPAGINPNRIGLLRAAVAADTSRLDMVYLGPKDFL